MSKYERYENELTRLKELMTEEELSRLEDKAYGVEKPVHRYSRRFYALLDEIKELRRKKGQDYGTDVNPLANIQQSEDFGVPGWVGAIIRANDKITRLKSFATRGDLKNESVDDSLRDLAAYAIIALVLYEEESSPVNPYLPKDYVTPEGLSVDILTAGLEQAQNYHSASQERSPEASFPHTNSGFCPACTAGKDLLEDYKSIQETLA